MKNILVIGGNGFLGIHLVNKLESKSYNVFIADKISSNHNNYIKCDITSKDDIQKLFSKHNFNIVFNLAGFANLDDAISNPTKTMQLNVMCNMYIIEQCIKQKIEKYVYASSTYSMSKKGSFYGISKLASEKLIEEYNKKHGLNFIIIRYGSVYSDRDFKNNYIYNLVKNALKKKLIVHNGDGEELREYIHADDASELSVKLIENEDYLNKTFILTGNQSIKRIDLFNLINEIFGGGIEIQLMPGVNSNHYRLTPYSFDPVIAKKMIPNPEIDIGQGILQCIRKINENKDKGI